MYESNHQKLCGILERHDHSYKIFMCVYTMMHEECVITQLPQQPVLRYRN